MLGSELAIVIIVSSPLLLPPSPLCLPEQQAAGSHQHLLVKFSAVLLVLSPTTVSNIELSLLASSTLCRQASWCLGCALPQVRCHDTFTLQM
jgi:hypothetical protein